MKTAIKNLIRDLAFVAAVLGGIASINALWDHFDLPVLEDRHIIR